MRAGRWVIGVVLGGIIGAARAARADTPTPERPARSRTAVLVKTGTAEAEGGVAVTAGALSAPVLVKVGLGRVEPRAGLDAAALGGPGAALEGGAKLSLVRGKGGALSGWLGTNVPLGDGAAWVGQAHLLGTTRTEGGLLLQGNLGVDLGAAGGRPATAGVPAAALLGAPVGKRVVLLGEGTVELRGGGWALGGGARWALTRSLRLDAGAHWPLDGGPGTVTAGLVGNAGALGGR